MLARVEVLELVDPVQDVGDQLLQEHPGRDADLAAERPGDRIGEVGDVGVVDEARDPVRLPRRPPAYRSRTLRAERDQGVPVEAGQPELDGAGDCRTAGRWRSRWPAAGRAAAAGDALGPS